MIETYLIKCAILSIVVGIACGENHCDYSEIQGLSTRAMCDADGQFKACEKHIPPNTLIQIKCNTGYISSESIPQQIRCLSNGTFSEKRRPCSLNCGEVASSVPGLSKGGIPPNPRVPWNVAIYELGLEYTSICSGSIVSPRIVISAAHCFFDHSNLAQKQSQFQVSAGKLSKNYTKSSNENELTVDVAKIYIPSDYRGASDRFNNDIAILILKTPLEYNEYISAICMPSLSEYGKNVFNYVVSNLSGSIPGYNSGRTHQLEILHVRTMSYHDCGAVNPIAIDKFCISNDDGASVCRDASGAGFFIESTNILKEKNEYKLLGVISNAPSTINGCTQEGSNALVAVTSMHYLPLDFVKLLSDALKDDVAIF